MKKNTKRASAGFLVDRFRGSNMFKGIVKNATFPIMLFTATFHIKSIPITHSGHSKKFVKMTLKARLFIQTIMQSGNHSMTLSS